MITFKLINNNNNNKTKFKKINKLNKGPIIILKKLSKIIYRFKILITVAIITENNNYCSPKFYLYSLLEISNLAKEKL
jgi:hypothetical protein